MCKFKVFKVESRDERQKQKQKRIVAVGKLGPGIAWIRAELSFTQSIDTDGEEVSNVKSA